jgi:hypothetical protein
MSEVSDEKGNYFRYFDFDSDKEKETRAMFYSDLHFSNLIDSANCETRDVRKNQMTTIIDYAKTLTL